MVTVLTSPLDMRNSRDKPVGCSPKLDFTTLIGENSKILNLKNLAGQVIGIEYIVPNLDTDTTFDVTFYSKNDVEIASKTGLADTKTTGFFVNTYTDNIFIPQDCKIKVDFTTNQVATIEIILHMK